MSANTNIALTLAANSEVFYFQEDHILKVYPDSLGSKIIWAEDDGIRKEHIVTETAAQVTTAATLLFEVTAVDGGAVQINADKVIQVVDDTLGSLIEYRGGGHTREVFFVTEAPVTVQTAINAL